MYDPDLGRFLSADPFVQAPANPQNLNRYSYVLNNPLSYTDPSGFFFGKIFSGIKSLVRGIGRAVTAPIRAVTRVVKSVVSAVASQVKTIAAIGAAAVIGPYCAPCAGFAAGMISSGGDLKAGLLGAVTAQAFYGIGHSKAFGEFAGSFGALGEKAVRTVAHGVVGGVANAIGGGDFVSGFISAGAVQGFSQFGGFGTLGVSDAPTSIGGYAYNAIASAVVGGTASVLGGGKFKNGAITGAFSRLFNDLGLSHQTKKAADTANKNDNFFSKIRDVVETIKDNILDLGLAADLGAAFGSGVDISTGRSLRGDSRFVQGDIVKGLGAFGGATIEGDIYSTGKLQEGFVQSTSLCAGAGLAGCISFSHDGKNLGFSSKFGAGFGFKIDLITVGVRKDL